MPLSDSYFEVRGELQIGVRPSAKFTTSLARGLSIIRRQTPFSESMLRELGKKIEARKINPGRNLLSAKFSFYQFNFENLIFGNFTQLSKQGTGFSDRGVGVQRRTVVCAVKSIEYVLDLRADAVRPLGNMHWWMVGFLLDARTVQVSHSQVT